MSAAHQALAPHTRKPATKRPPQPPKIPYPELPSRDDVEAIRDTLFWRAAWLRTMAEIAALEAFTRRATFQRESDPLQLGIFRAINHCRREAKQDLDYLIKAGGLLYAWLPEGGAA